MANNVVTKNADGTTTTSAADTSGFINTFGNGGSTPIAPNAGQMPQGLATVPAPPVVPQMAPQAPQMQSAPSVSVNVNQAPSPDTTKPTESKTSSTTATPSYTVKSGDTLGGIAKSQGTTLADILASNPQYQNNPDLIKPGQTVNLAKKYQDFHESMGGTTAPDTNPRQQIQEATKEQDPATDHQTAFQDTLAGLNPVERSLYDQTQAAIGSTTTQQTYVDMLKSMETESGVPALKTELMNINNIMNGTEDDIRDEITKAGGTGTESQIQAMTAARNKTLLKQANALSNILQTKEDYINQIMTLTKADRAEATEQVDRKLGLTKQMSDLVDKQTSAAKENYQKIADSIGYQGLADLFNGDKAAMNKAEDVMGLPRNALSNPALLQSSVNKNMPASVQEFQFAQSQGYKGTFSQYQNEDANRKKSIAAAGVAGLTPNQVNQTVNGIANNFDNEQTVKDYNTVLSTMNALNKAGSNPTDDIQRVYAFAKIMDPNSVVREGEYKTVQDYSSALMQAAGIKLKRVFDNTGFLTPEARTMMNTTLGNVLAAKQDRYDNLSQQYQRQIDDAYAGKPRTITNYAGSASANTIKIGGQDVQVGSIITNAQGKKGKVNADGTITPL